MTELGPITCAACALLCDDVLVDDDLHLQPRCELGTRWITDRVRRDNAPAATIRGEAAELDAALARAAELLRGARRPLFYGLARATIDDARAAVALADRLGGLVATGGVNGAWPGAPAVPLRGASTATLGEIRERSRVVVIWREDPESTHPRLLDRLGFGDNSGADRVLVVIDDRDTATSRRADIPLSFAADRDLEALTGLHVLQRKRTLRAPGIESELTGLLELITAVPHVAFVHGAGLTDGEGGQRRALALHELVRELSHDRHVVTLALPTAAGIRSAQDVLAWQTGSAETIDLASGHPELVASTESLSVDEWVDVSVCIEGDRDELGEDVTQIALGSLPVQDVEVSIRTAAAGMQAGGTAHRLDGVPLTLQAPLPAGAPTAAAVLARLLQEVGP